MPSNKSVKIMGVEKMGEKETSGMHIFEIDLVTRIEAKEIGCPVLPCST